MRVARWGAVALAVAACAPAWAAGNQDAGRVKADTCLGCHGIPYYNNVYPTYRVPKIAGQSPEYIAAALRAYRSGERAHKTMQAQAATLSDQDIEDIATYLSQAPAR